MQIQQDLTKSSDNSSTLPPHEGLDHSFFQNHNGYSEVSCKLTQVDVSGKNPQLINTYTSEESTDGNPATGNRGTGHVKTRLRPAGLNRPRHDVYISDLHDEMSNDDIRGFMYDIGVSDIVSIERVHDTSSASAVSRVTINDYSIKHNVYNPKVYTNGIKAKPYRFYKQGTQIQDISKPILHNHQNHMTGSTVNNTGKDNQRPNPSQFQQNRSGQSLRKSNNNRMWPIKPQTENQIESPLLLSSASSDDNKSHDSITCAPSNTRPVQLNACAVPYIPRTYNPYTATCSCMSFKHPIGHITLYPRDAATNITSASTNTPNATTTSSTDATSKCTTVTTSTTDATTGTADATTGTTDATTTSTTGATTSTTTPATSTTDAITLYRHNSISLSCAPQSELTTRE